MPFTDYPNYMGLLLLALAVWAAAARRSWLTWTLVAGGLLAYLLSLGDNFFLYKLFYIVFPFFDKFRVPSMLLVLTQFSVAVLAGLGLDAWLSWLEGQKEGQARRVLLMAGGGVLALALVFLAASGPLTAGLPAPRGVSAQMLPQVNALRGALIRTDAFWLLAVGGLALGSVLLWRQGRLSRNWLLAGLVGLSVVDLARIDRRIIEPAPDSLRSPVLQPRAFLTRYTNSDPVTHNVHPSPEKNRDWNNSQSPGADPIEKAFSRPEIAVVVKCDVHPWMRTYVHVMKHPYFDVTGSDGSFEIKNLPPGKYILVAWQQQFGEQEMEITVGESETAEAEFTYTGK